MAYFPIDSLILFALSEYAKGNEKIADKSDVLELEKKYRNGGYGYGHAKKDLFEVILEKYKSQRELYNRYINNESVIEQKLIKGAEKANEIATTVLDRVRQNIGY